MRNRWNQGVVAVLACLTIVFTGCASMQTTMTNVGNSLAFWKKSAPKDQFATNLTSPAATGTPTGAYGPNSIAQNQPSSYPFANTGNRQNDSSQDKFGQNANVASNTPASGTRTPYNTPYPAASTATASQNQFGTGQPAVRTASATSNNFSGTSGGVTPVAPSAGGASAYGNPSRMNTTTPSSQFQSSNAYQPSSSSFAPSPSPAVNAGRAGFAPSSGASPAAASPSPSEYPKTPYAKFGATQSATPSAATSPSGTPSFGASKPNPTMSSNGGFSSSGNTTPVSAVSPSTPIARPPSLPQSVFSKTGGYSPGSTGVSGTATQAGFESQDLYNPNTASKIPTEKSGLYTPGQ